MNTFITDVLPAKIIMFSLVAALSVSSCTSLSENISKQEEVPEGIDHKEAVGESQAYDTLENEETGARKPTRPSVSDEAPYPEKTGEVLQERSSLVHVPQVPYPRSNEETPPEPLVPTKTTLQEIPLPMPHISLFPLPKEHTKENQEVEDEKEEDKVDGEDLREDRQELKEDRQELKEGPQERKEELGPQDQGRKGAEKEKETDPAAAEYYEEEIGYDRLLTVEENTLVTIPLKKEGWVFLSSSNQDSKMVFRGRKNKDDRTLFTFFTGAPTVEDLLFQLQDLERGTLEKRTLRIRVLSKYEYTESQKEKEREDVSLPDNASQKAAGEDTAEKRYRRAKEHYKKEEYKEALAGFLSSYHMEKSPEIAEKIAELYEILSNYSAALTWWEKNLNAASPFKEKALKGIIDLAILEERVALLEKYIEDFLKIQGPDIAGTVESLAHFYLMRKDFPMAIRTLEHFFKIPRKKTGMDSLYFLLASIYERPGKTRNIKKAKDYYTIVYDEYPLSSYWTAAKERINYIDRYYLKIR